MKTPGDGRDEATGLHSPQSLRKNQQDKENTAERAEVSREEKKDESPQVRKLKRFIEFREIVKVKNFLEELNGEVGAVSSETKKNIGPIKAEKHLWLPREIDAFLIHCVSKGDYADALDFFNNNEQYILEQWVDGYLNAKSYHQAADTLRQYAKTKPHKEMKEKEIELEEDIDKEILSGRDTLIDIKLNGYVPEHDRVWSMIHHGCYAQAAELCDRLNAQEYNGETLEEAITKRGTQKSSQKDTVPTPMRVEETPSQVENRHEEELLRALPETAEKMRVVFENVPELISHYHHLANIDVNDMLYLEALKSSFEPMINRLFDEQKVVIKEKGMVPPQEDLLGIVDDLGYLGLHLYINKRSNDNELHLLPEHEADPDYYSQVDLNDLTPNDIVLDDRNFNEIEPVTLRMDEEKTLTGKEPTVRREAKKFVWTSKVVTMKHEKAEELRRAA